MLWAVRGWGGVPGGLWMSYHKVLGLEKEPFSTSPDPDFFYLSREHKAALYRVRVAIKLRRGLSLVLGDVGMGKTTLSRKLSQILRGVDSEEDLHMILNPFFGSRKEFLAHLAGLFRIPVPERRPTERDYVAAIETYLFDRAVEQNRTVVLLIDEAQQLQHHALEALRILLNYETNEYKLLQVVLMGQMEFLPRISGMKNLWDRIALKFVLNPLDERECREMIEFRLRQAGYRGAAPLFTDDALSLIADYTRGYPRRISMLCHNLLEALVMYDKKVVDRQTVWQVMGTEVDPDAHEHAPEWSATHAV